MSYRFVPRVRNLGAYRPPAWLAYSILTLLLWGIWGVTSKVVLNEIDAYTNQVMFGVGMMPLFLLVAFSPHLRGGLDRRRGIFYAVVTGTLGGLGNILFFQSLREGGKASVVVPIHAGTGIPMIPLNGVVGNHRRYPKAIHKHHFRPAFVSRVLSVALRDAA